MNFIVFYKFKLKIYKLIELKQNKSNQNKLKQIN